MSSYSLEVRDGIRGVSQPFPLVGRDAFVIGSVHGSGETPDIAVDSRTLATRQFRLERDRASWKVEHIGGAAPTLIGGTPLPTSRKQRIGAGTEIKVANHTFRLVAEDAHESTDERAEAAGGRRSDAEALAEMAGRVHRDLIQALKQMHGTVGGAGIEDGDYFSPQERAFLETRLESTCADIVRGLGPDDVDLVASGAMHRRCAEMIVDADGSAAPHHGSEEGRALHAHAARFLSDIGVALTPGSLADDLDIFNDAFDRLGRARQQRLDEGIKRTIIRQMLARSVAQIVFGLGPIQSLIEMDAISEIMVISAQQIFVEKAGRLRELPYGFPNEDALMLTIERIVDKAGRRIDQQSPLVDARLEDGSRVNAVIRPLALKGPALTIRKFPDTPLTLEQLEGFGAMSRAMRLFLEACVKAQMSTVVSGGTGSGKTTLLNALSGFIDPGERVVTIEDTAELKMMQEHVITLQARAAGIESKGAVSIQDLVKNALRMRPDRIIVGECRGAEAFDMLQAMNTGHEGSMTTAHANSPTEMMLRLEAMVQMGYREMPSTAIRRQIASAVDIVVQTERGAMGRRVTAISEVVGFDEETGKLLVEDIFTYHLRKDADGRLHEKHAFSGYLPNRIGAIMRDGGFEWSGLATATTTAEGTP